MILTDTIFSDFHGSNSTRECSKVHERILLATRINIGYYHRSVGFIGTCW